MDFAEHEFGLSKRDDKGVTLRDHLLQVQKSLGRPPKGLVGPPFPDRYAHLWTMFIDLSSGRSYSSGGPNPLSWSDIKAWDDLMRAGLQEWEVRSVKALDLLWLKKMNEADNG
jgi:hypothetical protein